MERDGVALELAPAAQRQGQGEPQPTQRAGLEIDDLGDPQHLAHVAVDVDALVQVGLGEAEVVAGEQGLERRGVAHHHAGPDEQREIRSNGLKPSKRGRDLPLEVACRQRNLPRKDEEGSSSPV